DDLVVRRRPPAIYVDSIVTGGHDGNDAAFGEAAPHLVLFILVAFAIAALGAAVAILAIVEPAHACSLWLGTLPWRVDIERQADRRGSRAGKVVRGTHSDTVPARRTQRRWR